jgi:DNA-binding MarR family transcriptional regulator
MQCSASGKMLSALQSFLRNDRNMHLEGILVFLRVCEGDGLSIKDLVYLCGLGESMVSRSVESLRSQKGGLVRIEQHPDDRRRRLVFLTEEGLRLREEIGQILATPSPSAPN